MYADAHQRWIKKVLDPTFSDKPEANIIKRKHGINSCSGASAQTTWLKSKQIIIFKILRFWFTSFFNPFHLQNHKESHLFRAEPTSPDDGHIAPSSGLKVGWFYYSATQKVEFVQHLLKMYIIKYQYLASLNQYIISTKNILIFSFRLK